MRSLTSSRPAWSASSTSRASHRIELLLGALAPRHGDQPVEVGADHRRLARLLAHALEAAELLARPARARPRACRPRRSSCGTPRRRRRRPRRAPADRLHLLAQEVLALLLSRRRTGRRRGCAAHLQLGQPLALELDGELEALGHVERLEQLDLLLEGEVGRVADGVGQRARLGDRAQERGDALVVAAQLEDLLDRRRGTRARASRVRPSTGIVVGALLDLDAQAAAGVGVGGAGDAAGDARERRRRGRRRAGGRARRPRRSCRPRRTRRRGAGRAATRSSSPTSTGSVTSMVGKTTVSSSGTRRRAVMSDASPSVATYETYVEEEYHRSQSLRLRSWHDRQIRRVRALQPS